MSSYKKQALRGTPRPLMQSLAGILELEKDGKDFKKGEIPETVTVL